MPILTGCCCFASLKTGSRASAIFTIVTAIIFIAIDIGSLVRMHWADRHLEPQEKFVYFPPGIIPLIYIELLANLVMIGMGIILLIGINYGTDGKKLIYCWIFSVIVDRLYDIFLGCYILIWIGGHRFSDVMFVLPESIVVAVLWILDSIILVVAIICVISHWQDLQDEIYGKERRMKYYNKLVNIRTAALSGAATPSRSYFSSRSMLLLSQSQQSLNQSYPGKI